MTSNQTTPVQTGPTGVELMGALCSLLIHDFANHLSVISGNAQCAQIFADDPKRASAALTSILHASESAARLLAKCGELRRGLGTGFPPGDLSRLAGVISDRAFRLPAWEVKVPVPLDGQVALTPEWIAFTAYQFAKETHADGGTVSLSRKESASKSASAFATLPLCKEFLEVELTYRSDEPFPFDTIRSKHTNLSLLAACEVVKAVGGWTACSAASPTHQRIIACVPVIEGDL